MAVLNIHGFGYKKEEFDICRTEYTPKIERILNTAGKGYYIYSNWQSRRSLISRRIKAGDVNIKSHMEKI